MRIAIREDETTQDILKELSLGDIKGFAEKDKFLLYQERIYIPIILRKKIIAKQYKLPIYKH